MSPQIDCAIACAVRGSSTSSRWIFSARRRCRPRRLSISAAVVGHRVAVPGQHQLHVELARRRQRVEVVHQRLRALAGAVERAGDQRVRRDVAEQVVARDQHAPLAVVEDGVGGGVAGPVMDVQHAVAQLHRLAVAQRARHVHRGAPGAEGARHRLERARHLRGGAVAHHDVDCEGVVGLGLLAVALEEGHRHVQRRDLRTRALGDQLHQADVVEVLVGDKDQARLVDRVAQALEAPLQLVQGRPRVGPAVHERQRLVLDHVDVDSAHRERASGSRAGGCPPLRPARRGRRSRGRDPTYSPRGAPAPDRRLRARRRAAGRRRLAGARARLHRALVRRQGAAGPRHEGGPEAARGPTACSAGP